MRTHRSLDDWDVRSWPSPPLLQQASAHRTAPRMARFGMPDTYSHGGDGGVAHGGGDGIGNDGGYMRQQHDTPGFGRTPPEIPRLQLSGLLHTVGLDTGGDGINSNTPIWDVGIRNVLACDATDEEDEEDHGGARGAHAAEGGTRTDKGPYTARLSTSSAGASSAHDDVSILADDTLSIQGDDVSVVVRHDDGVLTDTAAGAPCTALNTCQHNNSIAAVGTVTTDTTTCMTTTCTTTTTTAIRHSSDPVKDMATALSELQRNIEKLSTCPSLVNSPRAYTHRSMHGYTSVPGSPSMYTARSTGWLSARTNSSSDVYGVPSSAAAMMAATGGGVENGVGNGVVRSIGGQVDGQHGQQLPSSFMAELLDRSWVDGCHDVDKLKQAVVALQSMQLGVAVAAAAASPPHMVCVFVVGCTCCGVCTCCRVCTYGGGVVICVLMVVCVMCWWWCDCCIAACAHILPIHPLLTNSTHNT